MEQYISKDALVAEIERRRRDWRFGSSTEAKFKREECDDILSFLDTLEVKEVGVDLGDPNGDKSSEYIVDTKTLEVKDDVVSNDTLANSLEISRYGNPRNGNNSDLEEAAKNHKSAIHIVSPQWISEVEKAFKAGAQWQKKQLLDKACDWLERNGSYYIGCEQGQPCVTEELIKSLKKYLEKQI